MTTPKPVNNLVTMSARKPDPTGPLENKHGERLVNAYEQAHFYLDNPLLWGELFANVVRRYDQPMEGDRFLGHKELGICFKLPDGDGWRVYPGVSFVVVGKLVEGIEDPEHIDYLTIDALIDDGWEVD